MSMQVAENFKSSGFECSPGQGPTLTVSEPRVPLGVRYQTCYTGIMPPAGGYWTWGGGSK